MVFDIGELKVFVKYNNRDLKKIILSSHLSPFVVESYTIPHITIIHKNDYRDFAKVKKK